MPFFILTRFQDKIDKLLEGYLDNFIDEETYKRKKEELIQQKITLKGEKYTLGQKRMSGWIEPTKNFVNTLIQAGKIASWDFVPPFDFTAEFLASRRARRGEQTSLSSSENLQNPVWCGFTTTLETILAKISEKIQLASPRRRATRRHASQKILLYIF